MWSKAIAAVAFLTVGRAAWQDASLRIIILFLIACCCVIPSVAQEAPASNSSLESAPKSAQAEEFEAVVLPIAELKLGLGIEAKLGTGFCLDPACRFIGTNYHVAMLARPRSISGQAIVERYLATGPDDEGATVNESPSMPAMKYNFSRDLAIFELQNPLRNHHGISFHRNELQIGQEVDIYSYPAESMIRFRKLLQVHGTFEGQTPAGLLIFDYELSGGRAVRPGASGGIVVDSKTQQIVGVLNGIEGSGEAIAFAVPVESLEEFVSRVQPYLAQRLFPSSKRISPVSEDFYPKFAPSSANAMQHRPEESVAVQTLRKRAQGLADGMRDLVAVQTLAWGSQDDAPVRKSEYEVRVVDGYQRFRELPDGKKELQEVPLPTLNHSVGPGGEWAELPAKVGTDLNLKIKQAANVVRNGRSIKVFQYWASAEDGVCAFKTVADFDFFVVSKVDVIACYGEVWTDEDMNVLRISEHFELLGKWKNHQTVVTYGWLKKAGDVPRLIPLTIATQAEYKKKLYWCRGQFTDYQVLPGQGRFIASVAGNSGPRSGNEKRP